VVRHQRICLFMITLANWLATSGASSRRIFCLLECFLCLSQNQITQREIVIVDGSFGFKLIAF